MGHSVQHLESAPPRSDIAGPGSRFIATAIDTALVGVLLFFTTAMFAPKALTALLDPSARALRSIPASLRSSFPVLVLAASSFLYQGVSETWVNGRTLGKRLMALRAISADGEPLARHQAVVRNLMRVFDFLPLGYGVGGLLAVVGPSSQRLGDLVAKTLVVKESEVASRPPAAAPAPVAPSFTASAAGDTPPFGLVLPLSPDEQRLVAGFLERRARLLPTARTRLGEQLAQSLYQRHGGEWISPESYLERIAVGRHRG
jgi:uncharacterized RDD family membrane protein YckC